MADTQANDESSSSPAESPGIDLMRLYTALLRRAWIVVVIFTIVVSGVSVWTFHQRAIYRAEATVVIDYNAPQVLKNVPEVVELGGTNLWSGQEYFETQYKVIKSRMLAEKVVARLGLDHDLDFLGIDPNLPPEARAAALKAVDPIGRVIESITVLPARNSRVVVIGVEDWNPQRAADLANAIAGEFIEQNVDQRITQSQGASDFLSVQITQHRKELEASEKALYQFKDDHDVLSTSLEARQNISSERLVAISDSLTKTALRRVELEARRDSLKELLQEASARNGEFKAEAFRPVTDNLLINDYKREYFRLQNERAEIADRYLADHPKRVALDERIAKVKANIATTTQNVLDASESEYREVLDQEKRLRVLLEESKQEALAVNKLELEYERLKREKEQNLQIYEQMLKRQKEVDISALLRTNNIHMLDAALVPKSIAHPHRGQNILIGVLIGLILGCGLVILLELLDNTVKSQEDVENGLGIPLLGILPSIASGAGAAAQLTTPEGTVLRDLYVSRSPNSSVSECARSIRTSLLFASPDRPFKVLLVVSTGPREGKTTTAISIGTTMAQGGNRVLVIDGDLRRPRLHKTFGVSSTVGLSTLILGESTIEQSVKSTEIEGLFVLSAGPVPPNPAELLQSERFSEVLRGLSDRYDRVIIDSPPVGVVTDALVMSARADGLVMVLRSGLTPKKVALRGRRALLDVKAHIYGAVLNDVDLASRAGQYYYYYRYGYYPSEYGSSGGTPPKAPPSAIDPEAPA
jgi:capsular exopolysaccharide synthesis family protein